MFALGYSHFYRFTGQDDMGWRLREGWLLDAVLDLTWSADSEANGTFTATVKVTADPDHVGALSWPPFETVAEVELV